MIPFGIQLYSVRDELARDVPSTLAGLKSAGYDNVELFDVAPERAADWKRMLDDAGLRAVSAHIDYEIVTQRTEDCAAMAAEMGFEDIIVPWLDLKTLDAWREAAETMNGVGERLREQGLRLGYHNHDHEFKPYDGTKPFDVIFQMAAPENLFLELDVRWASEYGDDPVEIIRHFGARCRFLHLKDRPTSPDQRFVEVGRGAIDWAPIFEAGRDAGVQWYIVEQDESAIGSLESAAISAEFLLRQ